MLADEKILVTGVSGMVAAPIATYLAQQNEVWGIARFASDSVRGDALYSNPLSRASIEAQGVKTCAVDLGAPDFSELPDDFTYVLHLAHTRLEGQLDRALQVNAIGAGRVLQHCRRAKAALVMSSHAVYSPPPDVFHRSREGDDMGKAVTPWAPSSPASKISLEAVSRFCAEAFDLPVVIARLASVFGPGSCTWLDVCRKIAKDNFRIIGTGDNYHHIVYVEDLVEGLRRCGQTKGVEGKTYILTGPGPAKLRQLLVIIAQELGMNTSFTSLPAAPFRLYQRLCDFAHRSAGIQLVRSHYYDLFLMDQVFVADKARDELGYFPKVSLKDGFGRLIQWYREEGYLTPLVL